MYNLPNAQDIYDKQFVPRFVKENEDPFQMIHEWRRRDNKFKQDKAGMYPIAFLANPYNFAASILCRLYGLLDNSKFSINWVLLIESCVNSHIMKWATILSNNLAKVIIEYHQTRVASSRAVPQFFMSAYIFDVICFCIHLPTMGWKWTSNDPTPIFLSYKKMWEQN